MSVKPVSHPIAVRRFVSVAVLLAGALGILSAPALAVEEQLPGWELSAHTAPTYLRPGGRGVIVVKVLNVGAAFSKGTVTVTDTLPPGVTAMQAGSYSKGMTEVGPGEGEPGLESGRWDCSGDGPGGGVAGATVVTCANDPEGLPSLAGGGGIPTGPGFGITFVPQAPVPELAIGVRAPAAEGTIAEPNRVAIAGGGALNTAGTQDPVTVNSKSPPFGFANADAWFSNADGTIDTQAGSHPYEATFVFNMNNVLSETAFPHGQDAGGEERNLTFSLPPGFIGDPYVVPMCTSEQFNEKKCPPASQIGVISVEAPGEVFLSTDVVPEGTPVYNIVPPAGAPAEFGFQLFELNTMLVTHVNSGSDYGLTTHVNNIVQRDVFGSVLTLWGEPGNASHALWHDGGALKFGEKPFLTLPTSCEGAQRFSLSVNQWHDPSVESHISFLTHNSNDEPTGFTGCEVLGFGPSITTAPDTSNADTPAGLTVEVKAPLGGLLAPEGLGTADIKGTTVTLPPGVVINPGQAAGLEACQESESGLGTENAPSCPLASKVGTDEITLPVLKNNLQGNVYVLQSEPPHLKLLIAASGEGVNVKLVANVHLNEATGQLTATVTSGIPQFPNIPQAPVSAFKLSFSGGAQAALDTPTTCGTYTTESDFTPWASPFVASVFPTSAFAIAHGTNGAACPSSPLPFSPSLVAGSTTDQAGGFTDFSLLLQSGDDQQRIEKLQFKTPGGLSGMISQVPLCGEAQANAGTCPAASQIGHTVVASGPGPYPLVVPQPGQPPAAIYLTGPYQGAPFGLSIVVPIVVGPFVLETQVVRAKIEVDPHTAQITVTTDPLPQVVDGVPTDLRSINAVIDKPGFMFNPTNCSPSSFSGTAWGTPPPGAGGAGATAAISSHFGVGSCRGLEFHPKFSVFTSGKNSKANGASLTARVAYPNAAQGTQTNIGLVKVDLPKQLPSRLTTLQKACTLGQFDANPAGCPPASFIGHATVHTPELPVPLTGPAVFVSHGGEAFPTLTMVLQGDGVTIDLVGSTFINKQGITSTTFKTVPDAPFSTFELTLPQGPNSALATNVPAKANYSLCGQKLTMPTEFVGQNGAVIKQTTSVAITGCAKTKALTRAQKLTRALKACHKKPKGHKRSACERAAHKRFGTVKAKKNSKR
jgi:hypothetical protein